MRISRVLEDGVLEIARELQNRPVANKCWDRLSEDDLWNELVTCILGSQVTYEQAGYFADILKESRLLERFRREFDYDEFERGILDILVGNSFKSLNESSRYLRYRFPRAKARLIRKSAESFYSQDDSIRRLLRLSYNDNHARVLLISRVHGFGPKQASLFLRNTGFSDRLAILDTHVLSYMHLMGLLPVQIDRVLGYANYQSYENILQNYAHAFHTKLSHLDRAIWIMMRVYRREVTNEHGDFNIRGT